MTSTKLGGSVAFRALVSAVAVFGCAAPGCNAIQFEWQGPSDAFRAMDFDGDGAIDQREREWAHGTYRDRLLYFRSHDCDQDGRISWHEHYEQRFQARSCLPFDSSGWSVAPQVEKASPLVTSTADRVVSTTGGLRIHREPHAKPPRLPRPYSESTPRREQAERVALSSGSLERLDVPDLRDLMSGKAAQSAVSIQRLRCVVVNGNADLRVTLLDFDVEWTGVAPSVTPARRGYLKTLALEPGASAEILAWFPTAVTTARCSPRAVRGQAAG